jgi:hypothetical protein
VNPGTATFRDASEHLLVNMVSCSPCSAFVPQTSATSGNTTTPKDTSKSSREQRRMSVSAGSGFGRLLAYNGGAGGSNPSPPTSFVMFTIIHATAQCSSNPRHAKVLVKRRDSARILSTQVWGAEVIPRIRKEIQIRSNSSGRCSACSAFVPQEELTVCASQCSEAGVGRSCWSLSSPRRLSGRGS